MGARYLVPAFRQHNVLKRYFFSMLHISLNIWKIVIRYNRTIGQFYIQSRLVYCKTKGAPTTAIIGKVGFQSNQWIGCRPNRSVVYKAKLGVRGTLGPCNTRVLTAFFFDK